LIAMQTNSRGRNMTCIYELCHFINGAGELARPESIWHKLKDYTARFGMPFLFALSTQRIKKFAPGLLFTDSPQKLLDLLEQEWPPGSNPVLKHVQAAQKPFAMSEMKHEFSSIGFDWRKFAPAKVRGGDAFVVPITNDGVDAIAIFAGHDPDMRPLARALIQVAAQHAFRCIKALNEIGESAASRTDGLTKRERDCLRQAALGRKDAQIAEVLGISLRTVRFHFANAKSKLGAANRNEAVAITASARP